MRACKIMTLIAVFCTITCHADYSVPTNGLIGYWLGNGTAVDASPVGNNGSFGGVYGFGPTGRAFDLSSGKVSMPHSGAYNFRAYDGWSVGFWFNGNGSPVNSGNGLFLGQDDGSGYKPKWFINYGSTVFVGVNDWFSFHVNDYNQERIFINSQSEPSLTGWNQLTVTINNTNSGLVSFYLNGQPIGSGSLGNYGLQTSAPLIFGQAEGFSFNGLMSGVVIYNRVLSTNEVLQLATIPALVITNHPSSVTVSSGGAATFSVGVSGPGPISYQWMLYGTNIAAATNASFTITNIAASDTGVYSVAVTNLFEGALSASATLTTVDVRMFAGIIVNGVIGSNYTFQSTASLSVSNWGTITNVILPSRPYIYIDYSSIINNERFYRVFTLP